MKFSKGLASCWALCVATLLPGISLAASPTYSDGDLIVGFRSPSLPQNYVIDLGYFGNFLNGTASISLGNYGTDLVTDFGTGWYTNTSIQWGAVAGLNGDQSDGQVQNTIVVSQAVASIGSAPSNPYTASYPSSQAVVAAAVSVIGGNFNLYSVSPGSPSNNSLSQPSSDANSWSSQVAIINNNFSSSSGSIENAFTSAGATNAPLIITSLVPTFDDGVPGTDLGYLSIDNNGNLTFTPYSLANTGGGGGDGGGGAIYLGPWNWTNGSGNWSDGSNWQSNSVASNTINVGITGAGGIITNDTVSTLSSLTFSNGAGAFILTGTNATQTLEVTGGITNNSSATQTISIALNTTSNQTINAAAGNIVLGAISNTAALTMVETAGQSISVTNQLSGTGSLIQSGPGTLTLAFANSYSGGTTLNSGTVIAGDNSAFGSGTISVASSAAIAAGGNITLTNNVSLSGSSTATMDNRGNALGLNGVISGGGGLSLSGVGTTTLASSNSYAGGTTLNGGTATLGNGSAFGSGTVSIVSSSVVKAGASLTTTNAFTVAGAQTGTFDSGANTWTQSGAVGGLGGLTKTGSGTMTLSGSNTYSGSTLVSGGTLQITGFLLGSGTVTVGTGATLAGTGSIGKTTLQTGASISAGTNGSIGTMTLSSLVLNGGSSWNLKMLNASGAAGSGFDSLTIGNALDLSSLSINNRFAINLQTLSASATLGNASGFNANISTNWVIASYGSLVGTFSTNDFTINTTGFSNSLNGGTFGIGTNSSGLVLTYTTSYVSGVAGEWNTNSGALSSKPLITNGCGLIFSGSGGNVTNDALATLSGITFATNAGGYVLSGNAVTNGVGGIVNNSTNSQIISNNVTLASSQSFVANSNNLSLAGNLSLSSNTLTISGSNNTLISGLVSGSGGLAKSGSGSLILSGADSFTGGVSITAGTLLLSGGDNRLWTNSSLSIATGSTLDLGSNSQRLASLSGNGTVTGQGGQTLTLAPSNSTTFGGVIAGGEALAVSGAGTQTLSGSNSYSGGTVIASNATVVASNSYALGSSNNALSVSGALKLASNTVSQGAVTLGGGTISCGTLSATNVLLQGGAISARLIGSSTVTASTGSSVLSGSNAYTGGTIVSSGATLIASNASALGAATNALSVAGSLNLGSQTISQGTVALGGGTISAGTLSATNVLLGGGAISAGLVGSAGVNATNGTTILSGSNSYTGGTFVNGATLVASNTAALGASSNNVTITNGGVLNLGAGIISQGGVTLGGGTLSNGTLIASRGITVSGDSNSTISATIGGTNGLTKTGSGTLSISSALPAGSISLRQGVLASTSAVLGASSLTPVSVGISNGATWQNSGLVTVGGASSSTGSLTIGSGGTLSASGLLIASNATSKGTVTLGDSNGAAILSLGSGTIAFGAGNGNLVLNQSGQMRLSNSIVSLTSGKGTITGSGSGTTTLVGNDSGFSGSTTLNAGTMVLDTNSKLGGSVSLAGKSSVLALNTGASLTGTSAIGVAGTLLDNSGLAFTNAIRGQVVLASTGILQKTYATNQSVAGFGAGIGAGKSFSILAGTAAANGSNAPTLQAKLVNGALDFKGTFGNAAVMAITDPSFSAIKNTIQWYNTNTGTFQNTIAGNTGNKSAAISGMNGKSFVGSFSNFLLTANVPVGLGLIDANHNGSLLDDLNALSGVQINSTLAKIMGAYGYDASTHTSWAVIDHNSVFDSGDGSVTPDLTAAALNDAPVTADLSVFTPASVGVQVVPEPGTWGLMILGAGALLLSARRRRMRS